MLSIPFLRGRPQSYIPCSQFLSLFAFARTGRRCKGSYVRFSAAGDRPAAVLGPFAALVLTLSESLGQLREGILLLRKGHLAIRMGFNSQ